MTSSWLVAVNPTSGRGRGARWGRDTLALMREHGTDAEVVIADSAASLERSLLQKADRTRHDGLAVVGGDGMAHVGLNVARAADLPLGIIPAGTGNDFARQLRVPRGNLRRAVDTVLFGRTRSVDLGRLHDGRWFGCVLSTGFDAAVNARANRMRWPAGRSRYHAALVAELRAFRPRSVVIEVDGATHLHRAMLVAVGNGSSYGGGMRICPAADVEDGLFDVTVVDEISVPELLRLFPRVYSGSHVEHPQASVYQGARVTIRAAGEEAGQAVFADGEQVATLPVTASVDPGALRVRVPHLP